MFFTPADRNPFATRNVERLAFRGYGKDVNGILARWESAGFRGVIVGPEGTGKTTLLDAIERALAAKEWRIVRVSPQADQLPPKLVFPKGNFPVAVLLDCAGLLGRFRLCLWRWKGRRVAGWIETAHAPNGLPVIHETLTTEALLAELVEELAPGTRVPPGLFQKHRGNIRMALREMYDRA